MKPEEIQKAIAHLGGGRRKVRISLVEAAATGPEASGGAGQVQESDDEVTRRALSHPEVQRFREVFPDAEIRAVRNLKE